MKASNVSWSEIRKQYPEDRFIHVLPAEDSIFAHGSPQWRLDVTVIKFDAQDEKDVYAIETSGSGRDRVVKTVGLTKGALERLSSAAGISAVPERVDDRRDDLIAEFRAIATLATKGGEYRMISASKSWNGRIRKQVKRREAEKKFARYLSEGWNVYPNGKRTKPSECTPEEREAVIEEWFADEWLREQEYGPATAESKAMNRARRALLGIAAKYTVQEIRDKSFVVPRWMFEPDLSDPEIRRLVIQEGLAAQRRIFPALPAQQAAPAAALPAGPAAPVVLQEPTDDDRDEALAEDAEFEERPRDPVPDERDRRPAPPPAAAADEDLPGSEREGQDQDDVDAIADDELSFYIASSLPRYNGTELERVKAGWEKYSAIRNPDGYKALRQILRHVLRHQRTKN